MNDRDISSELKSALTQNDFIVSEAIQLKFLTFLQLLQRWNKIYNLTAIRDLREMIWLHIIDSLSINKFLHGDNIIDIGTGAGLPGIPLALINPEKKFTLLDSNSKKTRFLTQVVLELGINNIEVVHARCEDFTPVQLFDSIVSRAFSSIEDMLLKTQHLLAPHGKFIAMKGHYPKDELATIPASFKIEGIQPLKIQGLDAERHVIFIKRT